MTSENVSTAKNASRHITELVARVTSTMYTNNTTKTLQQQARPISFRNCAASGTALPTHMTMMNKTKVQTTLPDTLSTAHVSATGQNENRFAYTLMTPHPMMQSRTVSSINVNAVANDIVFVGAISSAGAGGGGSFSALRS
jgi:hypothetical protein